MVKIKYTGNGISSRGYKFSSTTNDGLFDIPKEDSEYFLKTFPSHFELIEKSVDKKENIVEKKPRAKRTRKKSTDVVEG